MNAVLLDAARAGGVIISAAVDTGEIPGAAFGVATIADGIVWTCAEGRVGDDVGTPTGPDTPFCLASTTKPVATTVLGALVDSGRLGLDDPIRRLVPEIPDALVDSAPLTVRAVAAHTAGFGTHHRFFYEDERSPIGVSDAVRTLARPVLPVGAEWRYSNLGYGVLELAMERAAGDSMASLVERLVYRPLGMGSSSWGGHVGPAGAARRHLGVDELYPGYVTDHPSASEAWCSILDLLRFGLAHAGRSHLRPETHDTLATPTAPRQPDGAAYALGWVTREYNGVRLLIHGGRMGGVGAHLVVAPSLGLVVAGVANVETDRLGEAVAQVLTAVVGGYRPPPPVAPWIPGRPHPALARRWTGAVHFGDDELPVVLDASGERVRVTIAGESHEVVSPLLQPDGVRGHVLSEVRHPLVPAGSICHLDAMVGRLGVMGVDDVPAGEVEAADVVVGALVAAQYPSPARPRQGDAVSGALLLRRDR